jgi:hypothetical protein
MMTFAPSSTSVTQVSSTPAAIMRMWDQAAQSVSVLWPSEEWPTLSGASVAQVVRQGVETVRLLGVLPADPEADRIMSEWLAEQPARAPRRALSRKK